MNNIMINFHKIITNSTKKLLTINIVLIVYVLFNKNDIYISIYFLFLVALYEADIF
jgi:hypothetical protein